VPSRPKSSGRGSAKWPLNLLLALCVVAALGLGPRLIDGFAALAWVRYYAAQGPAEHRAGEQAERAGRAAARAIERTAPLPTAGQAALLALDLGRHIEPRDPAAALVLYEHVRKALDLVTASSLRGLGLAAAAAQARDLEEAARRKLGASAAP